MAQLKTCPDVATFQNLVRGEASEDVLEDFAEHLAGCPRCAEAAEGALAGDTLADAVRAQATLGATPVPPEAVLERLIRLGRTGTPGSTPGTVTDTLDTCGDGGRAMAALGFLAPAQAGDEIGRLGSYRVLELLGAGGMGMVFQAEDLHLRRKVALKVMRPEAAHKPGARERFLREAQAAATVEHEHVVTIHHVGEEGGVPFLAMQWLKGMSLEDYLLKRATLKPAQVVRLGQQIALGLAAAHAQGLIHRDIKPANIWIEPTHGGHVKLLDFGLARALTDELHLTQSGAILGTPAYMAPEQGRGEKVDHRCDLFSLGVVLYRMATGTLPFRGDTTMAMLTSLAVDTPAAPHSLNAELPAELSELIMTLLAKDPARRPASAAAVAAALDQLAAAVPITLPVDTDATTVPAPWAGIDQPPATAEASLPTQPAARKPRRRLPLTVAAALLLLAGGALLLPQILIRLTDKEGNVREIEVKPGEKIEIVQKPADGKGPKTKAAPAAKDGEPDRKAAEYVLSIGGIVRVDDQELDIAAAADLPKGTFRLTYLNLDRNQKLTDAGLAHFQGCKNLTILGLSRTPVTDAGLAHFKGCKNLTGLHLGSTQVTDTGLAHFKECKNLTNLGVYSTQVTDAGLAHFKGCKNLTILNLSGTLVTDAGLARFEGCKNLTGLFLENTRVTDAGLAHFKDCKNLTYLGLENTPVAGVGLVHLKDCKRLTSLILQNTGVTDAGLVHLKECKNLTQLSLNGTRVTDAGLVHLKECKNLMGLGLVRTAVTDAGLAHLKECKNLTELALSGIAVTDAGLAHLKECKNLTKLILYSTGVTDTGLSHLKECKNLTHLNLYRTRVTDASLEILVGLPYLADLMLIDTRVSRYGFEQLKAALPKAKIEWSEPNRRAAEQVLVLGGAADIAESGKDARPARMDEPLPDKFFQLRRVTLRDCKKPLGEVSATLALLTFAETDRLEAVDLSGTPLPDTGFLAPIHGLANLSLARTGVGDAHLATLPLVQRLVLDGNAIRGPGLEALARQAELTELSLAKVGLSDDDLARLPKLPKLAMLTLDGNPVRVPGIVSLARQEGLVELSLAGTAVTDLTVKHLAGLKALKRLSLADTGLTDAGLKHLHSLTALERLDLTGTKVTADGVAVLEKALPKCKVTRSK